MNKKMKISAIAVLTALALLAAWRITALNLRFPAIKVIETPPGETVGIDGLEVTLISYEIQDGRELNREIAECLSEYTEDENLFFMPEGLGEEKMLIVTLKLANSGGEEASIPLYEFTAVSKTWQNGLSREGYIILNPEQEGLIANLEPGEETEVKLVYGLYEKHFRARRWANLEKEPMELDYIDYPTKTVLKLN